MEIQRNLYLQKLIACQHDGQIKVITGLRRCGKSFLLFHLFKNYLLDNGTDNQQIITFELDQMKDIQYRNPIELSKKIHSIVDNTTQQYYLFIDEVQMSDEVNNPYNPKGKKISFYDMLNDLKELSNLDIYVTGSNSKMLSNDILTEFRGRSDEIKRRHLIIIRFMVECLFYSQNKTKPPRLNIWKTYLKKCIFEIL